MDSMQPLENSLPSSASRQQSDDTQRSDSSNWPREPPPDLLTAFKAAALSVTQLYQSASNATSHSNSASESSGNDGKKSGYKSCLEDLEAFLASAKPDVDGIRDWMEKKIEALQGDDFEDERTRRRRNQSSSSPPDQPFTKEETDTATTGLGVSVPDETEASMAVDSSTPPTADGTFDFRSSTMLPFESPSTNTDVTYERSVSTPTSPKTFRFDVYPTPSNSSPRPSRRSGSLSARQSDRSSMGPSPLGPGAGIKRKIHLSDFFNVDNLDFGGGGGAKKGRFS